MPKLIKQVLNTPDFKLLKAIKIENQGLERVLEHLVQCIDLRALFLKGNRIITRDLPYVTFMTKLRKLDLSNNNIFFLPDYQQMQTLKNLEFLFLHENEIVGWH